MRQFWFKNKSHTNLRAVQASFSQVTRKAQGSRGVLIYNLTPSDTDAVVTTVVVLCWLKLPPVTTSDVK